MPRFGDVRMVPGVNSDSPADPLLTSFPDDTQGGPTAPLAGPQGRFGRVIHAIDPRQLIGVLALAAGVGCGIAESFLHKPGPWLEIIALAATLGGVWLLAQGWRMPAFFLPTSLVCLLIGGLGFGLRFDAMSWPGLGAGAALAMCWGQRRHKSIQWLVGSALAACYVVAAVAGLVECSRGGGLLWITALGCMGVGLFTVVR